MSRRNHAEGLDLPVQALGFAMQDYTNCTHEHWKKFGYVRGKPRMACCFCNKTQLIGAKWTWTPAIDRLQVLAPMFRAGVSAKQAALNCRMSKRRVEELYAHLRVIQATGVVDPEALKHRAKGCTKG